MSRAKSAKAEAARELYRQGAALKDIAEQLGVPEGTVRSWKKRANWECNVAKDECNVAKKKCTDNKTPVPEKMVPVEDITGSSEELTERQRLFCLYYVRCFNATKAYQKAYGCSYEAAAAVSYRLLANVGVRVEIQRLKENRYQRELINEQDIFQKYLDIAFADITDVVSLNGENVRFKDGGAVDGTIVSEIRGGKGVTVKLADRMRALQWLTEHMNIATEEQKARIAALKARSAVDIPEEIDTSYVDALKELAGKVWDEAQD